MRRVGCGIGGLLFLAAAGCGRIAPPSGPARGPRMGPEVGALVARLRDPARSLAERRAEWETAAGKLISVRGEVAAVSEEVLLATEAGGPSGRIFVAARPARPEELSAVRPGQRLKVLGALVVGPGDPARLGERSAPLRLRDARLQVQ